MQKSDICIIDCRSKLVKKNANQIKYLHFYPFCGKIYLEYMRF